MILQIRLNLDIFTVWKKLKNSVVKCEKTFSLYLFMYLMGRLSCVMADRLIKSKQFFSQNEPPIKGWLKL